MQLGPFRIEPARVEELLTEAWLRRAPKARAERLDRRGS